MASNLGDRVGRVAAGPIPENLRPFTARRCSICCKLWSVANGGSAASSRGRSSRRRRSSKGTVSARRVHRGGWLRPLLVALRGSLSQVLLISQRGRSSRRARRQCGSRVAHRDSRSSSPPERGVPRLASKGATFLRWVNSGGSRAQSSATVDHERLHRARQIAAMNCEEAHERPHHSTCASDHRTTRGPGTVGRGLRSRRRSASG